MLSFSPLENCGEYLKAYIPTWIVTGAIFAISFIMELTCEPFKRHFVLSDPSISYPFSYHERFNDTNLWLSAVLVPYVVMIGISSLKHLFGGEQNTPKYAHILHITTLAFFLAMGINGFVTEFLKLRIGKLRPDFLERCGPTIDSSAALIGKVYNETICSKPLGEILFKDGFKSCPSGHSSFAWCGFNFLNLWISGQLHLHSPLDQDIDPIANPSQNSKYHRFHLLQLVNLVPIGCALQISLSRSQDYRHDFIDISLGSFIGFAVSTFIYCQFFRSIFGYHSSETKFSDYQVMNSYNDIPL
ncbi:hypothetical protein HII12_001359 [Brettanomyces bruxellensis]|uniref:DEBR0S2_07624g1_1 n=1 Tax=Dekkera bruxellensis TaxID=5007 RepID=A0A7D9CWX6_DEKBR|nr:hypothetical protein HII12_001359 [Brettanomyces bruxellensis]VUG17456.1 DEBR0S2_07624g1_1 [Brettanomyces bruxellensis]